MSARLALVVRKTLHVKGLGTFHPGGVIGYRTALASAFRLAVESDLGELAILTEEDLATRASSPWPGEESGVVCGSVLRVGVVDPNFESRRTRYRAEWLAGLSKSERAEFEIASGIAPHKFANVRGWPATLPPEAAPWIERADRFADAKIRVDAKRARAAAEFAHEEELRLFAVFEQQATRTAEAAEAAVKAAREAADRAAEFVRAEIKPLAEIKQVAEGTGKKATAARAELTAFAQEQKRAEVQRLVNGALLEADKVRSAGVLPRDKIDRALKLANDAAQLFSGGDLDAALTAVQATSAELEPRGISGDGVQFS